MKINGKYTASNFFVRQGVTLDTDKKCFRKSNKIMSLFTVYDECKNLPKSDYILMFRILYAKCESCGIDDFDSSSVIQLSLVYNKNRKFIVHESKNIDVIKQMTEQLSLTLNLKVKDSASGRRNPKWL